MNTKTQTHKRTYLSPANITVLQGFILNGIFKKHKFINTQSQQTQTHTRTYPSLANFIVLQDF